MMVMAQIEARQRKNGSVTDYVRWIDRDSRHGAVRTVWRNSAFSLEAIFCVIRRSRRRLGAPVQDAECIRNPGRVDVNAGPYR